MGRRITRSARTTTSMCDAIRAVASPRCRDACWTTRPAPCKRARAMWSRATSSYSAGYVQSARKANPVRLELVGFRRLAERGQVLAEEARRARRRTRAGAGIDLDL